MQKNKAKKASFLLSQKKIFSALLNCFQLIETYKPKSTYILYICLLFYFFQIGSYFSDIFITKANDTAILAIFKIYFYSNFVNFFHLDYLNKIKLACFICFFTINFLIIFSLLLQILLPKEMRKKLFTSKIINEKLSMLYFFYDWICFIPALETFLNFYDCNRYIEELCSNDNVAFFFFSIVSFFLTIWIRLFFYYFNRDYIFLSIRGLKEQSNVSSIMIFLARISLVVFKKIASDSEWVFLGFTMLFCFFSLVFYFETFPFRNKEVNKFYLSNLLSLTFFVIIVGLWRADILSENDLFFYFIFLTMLAFKLACKIYEKYYIIFLVKRKANDHESKLFSLEEVCNIYYYHDNPKDQSTIFGFFKNHFKHCEDQKCKKLKKEIFSEKSMDFSNQIYMLSKFVSLHLYVNLMKLRNKKIKKEMYLEELYILKFITMTIEYDMNVVRSHFEIQKIGSETDDFSLFFNIASLYLKSIIKSNIKFLIYKSTMFISSESDANMDCDDFFRAMKIKSKLEEELAVVLQQKIKFFESLKNGQNSLGNLLLMSMLMKPKAEGLKKNIYLIENLKAPYYRAIKLKFESIYQAIILNHIFEGRKLEQELIATLVQNTGSKSLINSEFNFLDENFVTVCSNFDGYNGYIKDASFSKKFKNFFGLSRESIRHMKSIEDYMPPIIAKKHSTFIKDFINDSKRNSKIREVEIYSYGLNGEGFIFPLKLMIGFNIDFENEFLMNAAFKKSGNLNEKIVLCSPQGNILNISKSFFSEFLKEYPSIELKDFELMNIFKLIPKLSELITPYTSKNKIEKQFNLNTILFFPSSLLESIRMKKKKRTSIKELPNNAKLFSIIQTKQTNKSDPKERSLETLSGKEKIDELSNDNQTNNSKFKESDFYDEGSNRQATINFNLCLYKYSVDKEIDFFTINIFDMNYAELVAIAEKEETGFIPDSGEHENLVLPLENQPKIINLFVREKKEEHLQKENSEIRKIRENIFKKVKIEGKNMRQDDNFERKG